MADVLPPHSIEAEEALLGSLMIDPVSIPTIAILVNPKDFYSTKNGWIYEAILKLGNDADLLTLGAELAAQNLLESVGGDAYLAQLTASVPTALNAEAYARIVIDFAVRRRMIASASEIAKLAYDTKEKLEDCVSKAEGQFSKISFAGAKQSGGSMAASYDFYANWLDQNDVTSITTGIPLLDATLGGGLAQGEYAVIGSAPGVGKTILGIQMVLENLKKGKKIVYFSFEVRATDVFSRLVSRSLYTQNILIPYSRAIKRQISGVEKDRWLQEWNRLTNLYGDSLIVVDPATMTPNEIKARLVMESRKSPVDVFFIDHLHHLSDHQKAKDEFSRVTNVSVSLRQVPKDVLSITGNMPTMVCMAQLSRDGYDEPDIRSAKSSGQIESDAEDLIFLYNNSGNLQSGNTPANKTVCVKVAKARNGATGKFATPIEREYGVIK